MTTIDTITTSAVLDTEDQAATVQVPRDMQTALVQIVVPDAFSGTISFEGLLLDGMTWDDAYGPPDAGGAAVHQATGAGAWLINCTGKAEVRARASTVNSGSATVYISVFHGTILSSIIESINIDNTGLALESGGNLDAMKTDLDGLLANSAAFGQALMAASAPVVIASDQSAVPISSDDLDTLVTTAAAQALEAGGNLDAIVTALGTLALDASVTDLAAVIGTVSDVAWSGTGDGTVIAILKAIAVNTTPA